MGEELLVIKTLLGVDLLMKKQPVFGHRKKSTPTQR